MKGHDFGCNITAEDGDDMERTDRIAVEIQKEISDIIHNSIKDPRIPQMVSVTGVKVTRICAMLKFISAYTAVMRRSRTQ